MPLPNVTVRTMRRDEVDTAIDLAAREGWNPGLHDAACFHAADPDGFLLAECEGQTVGCISAVAYGTDFGFIGLFIVLPAWRGQGIGRRLWNAAMARLAGRVVGLDGVPAQQDNYRRSGFELAWQNVRFAGKARPPVPGGILPPSVAPLDAVDFAALCDEDRRVFPAPRDAFLRAWTTAPDTGGLAWLQGGRLKGWGLIRRCREGHKIGPLVAERAAVAGALFTGLSTWVPDGGTLFLDVPMPNAQALALAQSRGLEPVFETARMYAGPAPHCELDRVFGITSFELG